MKSLPPIPFSPHLALGSLLLKSRRPLPYPLEHQEIILTGYGRLALHFGLRALRIRENENVLVPSFICGAAIAPFVANAIQVRFYDLDSQLNPDPKSIISLIDQGTRGILFVNYFGFQQDISALREICNNYGIYLIEDNAHGLLSSTATHALGTMGDISIFSLRKTLPIPNGGALLINNPNVTLNPISEIKPYPAIKSGKFLIRSLLQITERALSINLVTRTNVSFHDGMSEKSLNDPVSLLEESSLDNYNYDIAALSMRIIHRLDYENIKSTRIKQYNSWLNYFAEMHDQNIKPLFNNLPAGVVPHSFPVIGTFDNLEKHLQATNIRYTIWPTLPRASSGWHMGKVLLLPIHTTQITL